MTFRGLVRFLVIWFVLMAIAVFLVEGVFGDRQKQTAGGRDAVAPVSVRALASAEPSVTTYDADLTAAFSLEGDLHSLAPEKAKAALLGKTVQWTLTVKLISIKDGVATVQNPKAPGEP